MTNIKTQSEAKKLKFGEQYTLDEIYPEDPDKITDAILDKVRKIKDIANNIAEEVK